MSYVNAILCLLISWLLVQHNAINKMNQQISKYENIVSEMNDKVTKTLEGYNNTLRSLAKGIDSLSKGIDATQSAVGKNVGRIDFINRQMKNIQLQMSSSEKGDNS